MLCPEVTLTQRSACRHCSPRYSGALFLLLLGVLATGQLASSQQLTDSQLWAASQEHMERCPKQEYKTSREHGVCGEMDIRNTVESFEALTNCTVIEGSLQISLISYADQEVYDRYRFPRLREITGYMMLFRVFGLRTLRHLFPNLAVIRGQKLFYSYALVAFEMPDLEDLGLAGLTTIVQGAVRLAKNFRLCYVDTVDWARIATGVDPSAHQFLENRYDGMCPNYCSPSCLNTTYQGVTRRHCWGDGPEACQKNLGCRCAGGVACSPDGQCCNPYCLGGCTGPSASDCYACKSVIYQNTCNPGCPPGTYTLAGRRCLTDKECLRLPPRTERNHKMSTRILPKLLDGTNGHPSMCVYRCPQGFTEKLDPDKKAVTTCVPCQGICPKVCNSTEVKTLEDSHKLKGCSKIDGYLEMSVIDGEDIDATLRENLGNIKEVRDYIRIMKSYALLTLHFLKSLEVIGGQKLAKDTYSLIVVDNTNLGELFPESQQKRITIKAGTVSFHGNRKLCYSKIKSFMKDVGIKPQLNQKGIMMHVSNTTNGDLTPCKAISLKLTVDSVLETMVKLNWEPYKTGDRRVLLNYVIYYKPVDGNVKDIFEGRDACSENSWSSRNQDPTGPGLVYSFIHRLREFTRYAVYVTANTIYSAQNKAQSEIVYFTTKPSAPTAPVDLTVFSPNQHELVVQWKPPKLPKGIVTQYKVYYKLQKSESSNYDKRDYCKNPINSAKQQEMARKKKEEEEKKKEAEKNKDPLCCECPKHHSQKDSIIKFREYQFENHLHDQLYCKRKETTIGSDVHRSFIDFLIENNVTVPKNLTKSRTKRASGLLSLWPKSSNTQEVIVQKPKAELANLLHFQSYSIEVRACHDINPDTNTQLCGEVALTTAQTKAGVVFDNINVSQVAVETVSNKSGDVFIGWQPPTNPNGHVIKYNIKYSHTEAVKMTIPDIRCISTQVYMNNSGGYVLSGLTAGNYTFQIRAFSLAGNGSYTPEMFFTILAKPEMEESKTNPVWYIGVVLFVVIVIAIITCIILYLLKKRKAKGDLVVSQNPHYLATEELYAPDEWEVERDNIRLIKDLGQGSFGTVYEGVMEDNGKQANKAVAIKTVNDKADFLERLKILREATTMKVFECHHVVKLLGVVSVGQPALVIMELMAKGDLRNHLRKCRVEEEEHPMLQPPSAKEIRQMAGEIADGMAYLADKKIVHRDLAARNCLVASDGTVKIADFGMARDVYLTSYYRKDQKALLPVRWMAPESLQDGIFTTMSDVWSYGIVLWEMVTLAEQPYQGLGNDEVLRVVAEGRVMNQPIGCPEDLYMTMKMCWAYSPKKRPTFKFLIEMLVPHLNDRFHQVSYFFKEIMGSDAEEEGSEANSNPAGAKASEANRRPGAERDGGEANRRLMWNVGDEERRSGNNGRGQSYNDSCEEDDLYTQQDTAAGNLPHMQSRASPTSSGHAKPARPTSSGHTKPARPTRGEHSPLLLHQGDVQEPLLYAASSWSSQDKLNRPGDTDSSEEEFVDSDFVDTFHPANLSLLTQSCGPGSSHPDGNPDSIIFKPSSLSASPSNAATLPSTSSSSPPKGSQPSKFLSKLPFPLAPLSSPSSRPSSGISQNSQANKQTPSQLPGPHSMPSLSEQSDSSRTVEEKEGSGWGNPFEPKEFGGGDAGGQNEPKWKSTGGAGASKDVGTGSGGHHRFSGGSAANGHGPFSHRQATFC